MKQATKSSYIKFFNDAINYNHSLKDQCIISGRNVNTVYMTMRNLRKKENKDEDDKKILELYDRLKNTKKKEVKKDTDDASNTWEIRDEETGKITGYKFEIFRRNKPAITGVFTRNEMNSVYRMYTYYGSGLTQQIVSRYFPDYSLIDFKRILRAFNITKAEEFENGDTLRQLLARSRYLLFKSPDKWTKSQKIRAELLFKQFEDIKHVYYYSLELGKIFSTNYDKDVARAKLALWYNKIEEYGYDTFTTVANSIENHYERILNFFVNRSTNAAAEAFNAKIKAFRTSFRGVVDMSFFLFRLAKVYA
jgi:hypothetical protein